MYGRNYYRPDQYVPKSVMEKRALPYIQGELTRLHANNAHMTADEAELEFLKVAPPAGLMKPFSGGAFLRTLGSPGVPAVARVRRDVLPGHAREKTSRRGGRPRSLCQRSRGL